jgi:hypothetical protein
MKPRILRVFTLLALVGGFFPHSVRAETSAPPIAGEMVYEGRLQSMQTIEERTSLQFANGDILEVPKVADELHSGDVVRIYKTDQGTTAHLWKKAANIPPTLDENALAPLVQFSVGQ